MNFIEPSVSENDNNNNNNNNNQQSLGIDNKKHISNKNISLNINKQSSTSENNFFAIVFKIYLLRLTVGNFLFFFDCSFSSGATIISFCSTSVFTVSPVFIPEVMFLLLVFFKVNK